MSAPSRFVREAMERRIAAGLCPVCGAELKKSLVKKITGQKQEPYCPNFNDGRHARPALSLKKLRKWQKSERKK